MPKKQSQIDKVTTLKDQASAKFEKAVTASEKKIFDEAVTLIHALETTPDGKIKASVANLKALAQIRTKLAKVAQNHEYLKAVQELAQEFDSIYKAQAQYFSTLTSKMHHESRYATMKELAVENTIGNLAGAGLQANVTDKLNDMLLRAVTSGAKYSDLMEEMRTYLRGDGEHPGALARYANTYTVTALSQYAGQNNKLLTDDLGCEWFEYVGSEIETTREFCDHLCDKRYIHKSEIPEILKGHIDGHKCKIYAKTGLPYGMIEGTTPENFQVNVGGWNCRHQLVPIAKEAVPPEIRAKFEKPKEEQQQQTTSKAWQEWMAGHTDEYQQWLKWKRVFPLDLSQVDNQQATAEEITESARLVRCQLFNFMQDKYNVQEQLNKAAKKALKAGLTELAAEAAATLEENKMYPNIPGSKAEYDQHIENMRREVEKIAAATKSAPPKPAGPKVQKKEVTEESVGITKSMTRVEALMKKADYIQKHLKVKAKTAHDYAEAIEDYTGNMYDGIRAAQIGDLDDADYKQAAERLEEFIAQSTKWGGGTTYRGIYRWEQSDVALFTTAQAAKMPIQMYGTSSWSTSKEEAKDFAMKDGEYHILFICKGGQPQGTSIAGLSCFPREREVLVSKEAKWLIDKIYQPDPTDDTYYEMEVIPC